MTLSSNLEVVMQGISGSCFGVIFLEEWCRKNSFRSVLDVISLAPKFRECRALVHLFLDGKASLGI